MRKSDSSSVVMNRTDDHLANDAESIDRLPPEHQPAYIFVTGMHRSGTSLVAKLLNFAGADIGRDSDLIVDADAFNPKGYFENKTVLSVDEDLLTTLGGAWYAPPYIPDSGPILQSVLHRVSEARVELDRRFSGSAVVALKDPRTSVLLPLWLTEFPNAKFVVCLRNPLDTAASLDRRDAYPPELSAALWALYTLGALRDADPEMRRIVRYGDLLDDPAKALTPIYRFLGLIDHVDWGSVREFTDVNLSHSTAGDDAFFSHKQVPQSVKALYAWTLDAGDTGRLKPDQFAEGEREWHAIAEKYRGLIDRFIASRDAFKQDIEYLQKDRDGLSAYYRSLVTKPLHWSLASLVHRRLQHKRT